MNVLDLFSGIGGFSLGLERAGMRTVAFCEIEPYPRAVLAKHWPGIPCYDDIRTLTAERLAADGVGPIDVICGGFPCQDISVAGKGAGLAGERSGLWREYARLIGELRPSYVIVENVAALLDGGAGVVLGNLAEIGYDAQWHCIPASYLGACHRRDRVWFIAYPFGANVESLDVQESIFVNSQESCGWEFARAIDAALPANDYIALRGNHDGVSGEMGALKAYGNAVVPQIPEIIGRAIMQAEAA